uniref:Uncharacterized protein n=1 Tax=Arundo donax TaxID=35708 RepID=A0A0A9FRJ7_ARUDO
MIRLTFAIGRNLSCSLGDENSALPVPPDSLSESGIAVAEPRNRATSPCSLPSNADQNDPKFQTQTKHTAPPNQER